MQKEFWKLGLLVALIALFPISVSAATIDVKKIPALNEYKLLPKADFEKQTKEIVNDAPYGDTLLSYNIRVPKDWTENVQLGAIGTDQTKVLSNSVLAILAKYISKPKQLVRSHVSVEAQELPFDISARNWFVNFTLSSGFTISTMKVVSSKELEAMYIQFSDNQTYAVRSRVIINGSRLILVRYYLPQDNFNEDKVLQEQVIKSFRIDSAGEGRIEQHKTYGFLDQSYFDYPVSWTLREKSILSVERMSATVTQEKKDPRGSDDKRKENVLEGQMRIILTSRLLKTTLAQEVDTFRKNLKIPGYKVGELIENIDYKYDPSITSGKAQTYKLTPDNAAIQKDYEILVTIMQGEDYFYITSMVTPARGSNFPLWSRNMEAAKIINESMRRFNMPKYDPNDPYFDYLKDAQ